MQVCITFYVFFFYEGAQRWEDICKGKLSLSMDYEDFFNQTTGTDTVCVCHTAWLCWFKLGWVCRFRKHHTALPIGGIQHQKHTSGQLYTEGTQTHTCKYSRKLYNEDAQLSPLSWDGKSYVFYFLVYFYHKHAVARGRVRGVSPQICVWCCVTSCSVSRGLCLACFGLCWAVFSNPQPPPMPGAVHSAPRIPQACILPPPPGAVHSAPRIPQACILPPPPGAVRRAPKITQAYILPPPPGAVHRAPKFTQACTFIAVESHTWPDHFNLYHCSPLTFEHPCVAIYVSLL